MNSVLVQSYWRVPTRHVPPTDENLRFHASAPRPASNSNLAQSSSPGNSFLTMIPDINLRFVRILPQPEAGSSDYAHKSPQAVVSGSDSGGSSLLQQGEAGLQSSGSELSLFSSFGASAPDPRAKAPENNNEDATFSSPEALLPPAKAGGSHQACNASPACRASTQGMSS